MSAKIDIAGLPKAVVLQALFNACTIDGMLYARKMPLTQAQTICDDGGSKISGNLAFDYVFGRSMKVDITGDQFCPLAYDRDNGSGAAEKAIQSIRSAN